MFCNKCGNKLENNNRFCTNCGNQVLLDKPVEEVLIINSDSNSNIQNVNQGIQVNQSSNFFQQLPQQNNLMQQNIHTSISDVKKGRNKVLDTGILIVSCCIIIFLFLLFNKKEVNYYTHKIISAEQNDEEINTNGKTSVDVTKYVDKYIDNEESYKDAIQKISNSEKEKCSKLSTLKYENEIMEKYNLYSVNLCELSDEYLEQILNIYEYAESEYPGIFDYAYATQILYDADTRYAISNNFSGAIALYGMIESYDGDKGSNNRLGMLLNTNYFLNETYFKQVMARNVSSKHFPSNATIYSPVMHELGHKLHFDLVFKKYNFANFSIVDNKEYDNYVRVIQDISGKTTTTKIVTDAIKNAYHINDVDDIKKYTAEISNYAKSDPNEAIAEAVHDWYLNGENAHKLSIEIVKVLKLERSKYFG